MATCPVCLTRLPMARTLVPFFNARAKIVCPRCSASLKSADRMVLYNIVAASVAAVMGAATAFSAAPFYIAIAGLATWIVATALWFVATIRFVRSEQTPRLNK